MFKHSDEIFDQIIEQIRIENKELEYYDFLKTTYKDHNYVSPFRSCLGEDYQLETERIRNETYQVSMPYSQFHQTTPKSLGYKHIEPKQKFARDVYFPEYLTINEERQAKERKIITAKENNLKLIKDSQKIHKIKESDFKTTYQYIEKPVDLLSVPKIPYDFYSKVKPKKTKVSNPKATPKNPEQLVYFSKNIDGKNYTFVYSKEVFDNSQLENKKNRSQIEHMSQITNNFFDSKVEEYNQQIKEKELEISDLQETINSLLTRNKKLLDFKSSNKVKKYLQNVKLYSDRKNQLFKEIEMMKNESRRLERQENNIAATVPTTSTTIPTITNTNKQPDNRSVDHGLQHNSNKNTSANKNKGLLTKPDSSSEFEYVTEEEVRYLD